MWSNKGMWEKGTTAWYGIVTGIKGEGKRQKKTQGRVEGLCEVTRWCENKGITAHFGIVVGIKGEGKRWGGGGGGTTTLKQRRLEGLCEVTRWCEKKVLQHGMVIGTGIKGEWKRGGETKTSEWLAWGNKVMWKKGITPWYGNWNWNQRWVKERGGNKDKWKVSVRWQLRYLRKRYYSIV